MSLAINSFDQVPQGLTVLLEKIEKLETLFISQQPQTTPAPAVDELLTRQEAAKYLKVSLPTLNEMTKEGTVKGYRIPGVNTLRYKTSDLNNALVAIKPAKAA